VCGGRQYTAAGLEVRCQLAPPVDAARISRPRIAGAVVQLHDDIDRKSTEPAYQIDAESVERRSRRPRGRIQHCRPIGSQSERAEHPPAIERPIDEAVDL